MPPRKTAVPVTPPILFVHGMWIHASAWRSWTDLFAAEGFDASAPAWPGEHPTAAQTRADAPALADLDMDRLVRHYADLLRDLPAQPVLVGHSLGGTVVQKLLAAGYGVGGVVLDSARFDGALPGALPTLRLSLPALAAPSPAAIDLTDYQFRFAYGRSLTATQSDDLYRSFAIPAPGRLLLEPETARIQLAPPPGRRGKQAAPLLALESGAASTEPATDPFGGPRAPLYDVPDTESIRFPDRGASFLFDDGWRDVAERALHWVQDRFGVAAPSGRSVALRGTAA